MSRTTSVKGSIELRIFLFGHFRIERGTKPIQLPTRKTESLLAYLILNPERHAREKLAALFWGDSSDAEARNSLRNAVAVLNKKLGHDLFLVDRQNIEVNSEYPLWVDVFEFESQISEFLANRGPDIDQVNFELYQDDLLSDFYDDWIVSQREHYRSLLLNTLLQVTQQMRSRSEYERAAEYARQALTFDPANERAHQHLMFCYMAQGDRSAALRQYEDCQRTLWEELAVQPATATAALYEWIKQSPSDANPFETRITNLPIPLTSFIGRKREMAKVKQLLASVRLLTLTGPGGSGKTRLAIQSATDLLDAFKDGAWWTDLAVLTDESLVTQSVAKALGVQEVANQSLRETLANFLRPKRLLLILDNCEHLIDACASIAEYLLEACPHLKVITTSRESLNLTGESTWYVPTLSLPDTQQTHPIELLAQYEGIRLFVERASAVRSDFVLTEQNARSVIQICQHLDGIPLAIELAAAKVKVLTTEQIAVRLNDRYQLLTSGSRTVIPRHQTLRAAIDWSYTLLSDKERTLFRRLAVFSGGWRLEASEAVCSGGDLDESEILGLLINLVDKSLVIKEQRQGSESRYRMLETIRRYAHEALLQSDEKSKFQKRHFDYYVKLVESAKPHLGFFLPDKEMVSWLRILEPEQDNLRAALKCSQAESNFAEAGLRMAGMLHWFWFVRSQFTEGRSWLEQILARSETVSTSVQAQAFLSAGFLACWQGDFASARSNLDQSLKLSKEINEQQAIAFSLHGLGFAALGLGDHALASSLLQKSLEIAREMDDKWLNAFSLHFIAVVNSYRGNYDLARSQLDECVKLLKDEFANMQGVAFSHFHNGRIARLQGDYASAHTHYADGIQLFWQMGDRRGLGYSLSGFACLALAQEELQRAARLFGIVDSIREDMGSLLEAILQTEFEQAKVTTQEILGEQEFNAAWSEGHKMTWKQAVQYALKGKNHDSH